MKLPYFGEIDLNNLEETYEVIINIENQKDCTLEMWFDSENLTINEVKPIINIINSLPEQIKKSKKYLLSEGRSVLNEYLSHHSAELSESEKLEFKIHQEDSNQDILRKLEETIHIKSISIWPESDKILKFDYTIGYLITDYVVCLNLNSELIFSNICIES